jgi:hypothetical protein
LRAHSLSSLAAKGLPERSRGARWGARWRARTWLPLVNPCSARSTHGGALVPASGVDAKHSGVHEVTARPSSSRGRRSLPPTLRATAIVNN